MAENRYLFHEQDWGTGVCPICGKEFQKNSLTHTYCSVKCKDKRDYEAKKAKRAEKIPDILECKWCGKSFNRNGTRRLFCSAECQVQWHNAKTKGKFYAEKLERLNAPRKKRNKSAPASNVPKDGFTWDEIKGVFAELGISSYHKALEILAERRKEAESKVFKDGEGNA